MESDFFSKKKTSGISFFYIAHALVELLELTLFLSASQQKGWLGQMGCHNFIGLRKRARVNIVAIKKLVESDFFSKKKTSGISFFF